MEIRDYNLNSFNLHLLKNNKSKSIHLEIIFRDNVTKTSVIKRSFLSDLLTDSSLKYPQRKDVVIKLEELYQTIFYGNYSKTGNVISTLFVMDFINPLYINDDNYYENVLKLPAEMILNPKVENKEFALKIFNVVKNRLKKDVENIEENPTKLCINKTFQTMDPNSPTSYTLYSALDEIDKLTPSSMYLDYLDMIQNSLCDIFIIGNLDFDKTYEIINKYYKLRTIKQKKLDLYINNLPKNKVKIGHSNANFVQTNLSLLYNLIDLTEDEKNNVMPVYNYILGSGGMNSKLYSLLRTDASFCYGIYSLNLRYDRLLLIEVALDEKNREKAIMFIKKCVKEIAKGDFSDEDIINAKINLSSALKISEDNNVSLLNNYAFEIFDNIPNIDKRIENINKVTKEEIIKVSKKIKLNTIYYLQSEDIDGKN